MGSGLFSVNKKHYLPETIRNIQREQKKTFSIDSMTTVSFKEEFSMFFKNVKYRINILGILVTKIYNLEVSQGTFGNLPCKFLVY